MLFNSIQFLFFFPLVTGLYFLSPHQYRWALLLVASCVFYAAFIPAYLLILFGLIIIDYWAAIFIERSSGRTRGLFLIISIVSTCLALFFFKYFNFFNASFAHIAELLHLSYPIPMLNIILPIGLSFHTFQSLSYVIEVYKGNYKAERHFGIYALYVMFFPQLVAGPIERPQNLLPQFKKEHVFDLDHSIQGLKQIIWGLFKKIVIADQLAVIVNLIYGHPSDYSGFHFLIASYAFYIQIYCDFSGYSDIAVGCARILGFRLMTNFRKPYVAESIPDFWKRWHISLTTWFKDYVYIPLGGNRVPVGRWSFNIFVVFALSGLWHGANWTFVVWGVLHALFYFLDRALTYVSRGLHAVFSGNNPIVKCIKIFVTFNLVTLAWIFFRGKTISECGFIIREIVFNFHFVHILSFISFSQITVLFLCLAPLFLKHFLDRSEAAGDVARPVAFLEPFFYALVLNYLIFFGARNNAPFIYFQF